MSPKLVILESPFAGSAERNKLNIDYGRRCLRDSLLRGEAPIASHLLYTQPDVLDDTIKNERQMGIDAGLAWRHVSEGTVVYTDRGISEGMKLGINAARAAGKPVELRSLQMANQPYLSPLLAAAQACVGIGTPDGWEAIGRKHLNGKCGSECKIRAT